MSPESLLLQVYMDGLLGTRSAVVKTDYERDTPELGIGKRGLHYFTQDRLQKYLTELQRNVGSDGSG